MPGIEIPIKLKYTKSGSSGAKGKGGDEKEPKKQTSLLGKLNGFGKGILAKLGLIGGILAILSGILNPLLDIVNYLVFNLMKGIFDTIKGISDFFSGSDNPFAKAGEQASTMIDNMKEHFANWNLEDQLQNNLITPMQQIGAKLSEIANGAWEVLKGAGQWVMDNVIAPGWEILKSVGTWIMDNIISPGWEALLGVGQWIMDNIITPGWEVLKTVGQLVWDTILKPAWQTLSNVGQWIWEQIIKPGFDFLSDIGSKIWEHMKSAFQWTVDLGAKLWDWIKSKLSGESSGSSKTGSKAFGGMISEDGLYMMHAGEQVSRGNTTNVNKSVNPNINVNVQGGSTAGAKDIANAMIDNLRAYSRW